MFWISDPSDDSNGGFSDSPFEGWPDDIGRGTIDNSTYICEREQATKPTNCPTRLGLGSAYGQSSESSAKTAARESVNFQCCGDHNKSSVQSWGLPKVCEDRTSGLWDASIWGCCASENFSSVPPVIH